MRKGHIINSDNFKYPTKDERKTVLEKYNHITSFDFKTEYSPIEAIQQKIFFEEIDRTHNLIHWNICLSNRLSLIEESFIIALTNYNRGFPKSWGQVDEVTFCYKWKFDYYSEVFYYFFFTTRDTIAQILNIFYRLGINEKDVSFNLNFINRIPSEKTRYELDYFYKNTTKASDIRNAFTHRFPPNQPDYRSKFSISNGRKQLGFYHGKVIDIEVIIQNMNDSLEALSNLMIALKKIILIRTVVV